MKLLLLDFDGVIVQTFRFSYEILKTMDGGPASEEAFRAAFNGGSESAPVHLKTVGGDGPRIAQMTPFFEQYGSWLMQTTPVAGMPECIRAVVAQGIPMVIVSSTIDQVIAQFLEQHGLRDAFQRIYGASVDKDKRIKLRQALVHFGVESKDAIFVTDTLGDLKDAATVGIPSIGVTWGYHPAATLTQGNPMAIVENPEELSTLLGRDVLSRTENRKEIIELMEKMGGCFRLPMQNR